MYNCKWRTSTVSVIIVNTPAIPPGQQLQVATFGMPESPPEQLIQTRQEPICTHHVCSSQASLPDQARKNLMRNCIEVTIAKGHCKGSDVFLPRISLNTF